MFGLYMLAIYLGVAIIGAGFVALLVVVALAVGLVTHPIRTLALVFHKLAALAAGLALILALIVWFWYDHSKPDFVPCFWGSIGVIVASILIRTFAEWILEPAHQGRTPSHETCRRAGNRQGDDVHAGIGRGGRGVRIDPGRPARLPMTCRPQDGTNRGWNNGLCNRNTKRGT